MNLEQAREIATELEVTGNVWSNVGFPQTDDLIEALKILEAHITKHHCEKADKYLTCCQLLLSAIPEGWSVPLLYPQIVAQVREVLKENKV